MAAGEDPQGEGPRSRLGEGLPSRTAFAAAVQRARHQRFDRPLVFEDALATVMVGPEAMAAIEAEGDQAGQPIRRALRALIAVRSRIVQDRLLEAIARGVSQVVVLGAGLDTLAYRSVLPPGVRVVEIDHPATQAWKRGILADREIDPPTGLRYVAVDLEREPLSAAFAAAELDRAAPLFVSWLGVTPYLTREAIRATLSTIASWPGGAEVIFDYGAIPDAAARAAASAEQVRAVADTMARVAAIGEPWITFFEPDDLAGELRSVGFAEIDDLGGAAINARYFAGRADGLRVGLTVHVADARTLAQRS